MTSVNESNGDHEQSEVKNDESVPTTPSSLLNRKGLFGNSAAGLREPSPMNVINIASQENENTSVEAVKSTPEIKPVEKDENSTNEQVVNTSDEITAKNEGSSNSNGSENKEDNESSEKAKNDDEKEEDSVAIEVVEEVFVKKIVSVDTSIVEDRDESSVSESLKVCEDSSEDKQVAENGDTKVEDDDGKEEDEDEDNEVPKKRAKRTAPLSESTDVPPPSSPHVKSTLPSNSDEGNEEIKTEDSDRSEEKTEDNTPIKPRGRRSRKNNSETEKEKKEVEEEAPVRARRSAATKKDEKPTPVAEPKTPRRGRGRTAKSTVEQTDTVSSITDEKDEDESEKNDTTVNEDVKEEEEEEKEENVEEEEEEVKKEILVEEETPKSGKRGRRSKATIKTEETVKEEKQVESGRRSTRQRNTSTATPISKPVSVRSKKVTVTEDEDQSEDVEMKTEDEEDVSIVKTPATPKGRRGRNVSAKATPASITKTPVIKKKEVEYDPYDMDTEMEKHPEPLKNIHMERQNFGSVKYAKVGSASKYEMTEKAAESRISNLANSTPVRKERKSLAEMAPGKEKLQHRTTGILGKERKRNKKVQEEEEIDEFDIDQDEEIRPSEKSRGRKRKSEVETPITPKKANIEIPRLSSEEQWKVDHPEDEHEPHAPGARVYALFDKVYYPAVVASERDGLNRFKVQFTADKIVKDVPAAGIIPIRVVVSGKECFFNEDVMNVLACPNAASADAWEKGIFELESLDESGEPTGETVKCEWSTISLDMNDWKEYIKEKSSKTAEVVTDNITTPSQMCRARKPKTPVVKSTPKAVSKKEPLPVKPPSSQLEMNEKGVGKNIFAGKIFLLTSANRQNSHLIPLVFRKKNLQEFLEQNGGIVTERFEEAEESDREAILISDTYYRTHKYLAALARNYPCVSNKWLSQCAQKGECIDYKEYILPAGMSLLHSENVLVEAKDPSNLLTGRRFFVHSTHNTPENTQIGPGATFTDIWRPIITLLGGEVLDIAADQPTDEQYDVLITDNTYLEEVYKKAEESEKPIVTSEWIIQTIINAKVPDFKAHEKFSPVHWSEKEENKNQTDN